MKNLNFIILLVVVLSYTTSYSQVNLVPNGSFEINNLTNTCYSFIDSVQDWFNPHGATPDYFTHYSFCTGITSLNNPNGFQLPKDGLSYVGIYTEGNPTREYIAVQLLSPLEMGEKYVLEFYVSLANECKFSVKNIGAYFTNDTSGFTTITTNIPVIPQIENQEIFLSDTMNWMKITGDFEASGGETFMIIGNFRNVSDTELKIVNNQSTWESSYYYIDQVSLVLLDDVSIQNLELETDNTTKIYPNPFNDYINIISKEIIDINDVKLTSINGIDYSAKIKIEKIDFGHWRINTGSIPSGQYVISINNLFFKKLINP